MCNTLTMVIGPPKFSHEQDQIARIKVSEQVIKLYCISITGSSV